MNQSPISKLLWYESFKTLITLGVAAIFQTRYFGRHHLPGRGGFLLVSNHQSHLDPPLVGIGCPRRLRFLARKTLFDIPVVGRLICRLNTIPLDRDGLGVSGIKESLRALKQGEPVLLFPEGTRSADGSMRPFRRGFTALAVRSRVPIVPVAIEGAYAAWPRGQRFPQLRPIAVCYGAPIPAEEVARLAEPELLALVEQRVSQCLEEARMRLGR